MDADLRQPERPRYAAPITEELLIGGRRLRHAFLQTPMRYVGRDTPLIRLSDPEPSVILMRSGFAFRSCGLADGRRAILQIVTPGDFVGSITSCCFALSRRSPRRTASATKRCAPRRSVL